MEKIFIHIRMIKGILIYYTICNLAGICGFTYILIYAARTNCPITLLSLIGSASSALIGCTIFYIRKLYKACINGVIEESSTDRFRPLGIVLYFIYRPLFSLAFSLLVVLLLKLSVNFVEISETTLNTNFILLTMCLGFFSGFASGDVLTFLEMRAKTIVPESFKKL